MDALDAIRLVNLFPDTNTVNLRNGYRVHATGLGTSSVQTLAEYASQGGARKLIGFANNKVYDATTYNAAASDITNSATITSNEWQVVNFRSRLVCVNGSDQPLQYDGTNMTSAAYTGVTDDADLIHVHVYKSRLYFVEKETAKIWYGKVNEITGVLTELDVAGLLQRGGYIQFTASFTRDIGDSTDDLFIIASNMGEILMYSGDYPGALNWTQVGRYFLPVPLGRRSYINLGADCVLITEMGMLPISEVMQNAEAKGLTDKINNAFRQAAILYGSNLGWQAMNYPRGHYMLVNVPTSQGSDAEQYVMNTETGSWCKFTGQRACCWGLLNEKLYFGGVDGKIYQADVGLSDNGNPIHIDVKGAFNYLGDKQRNKRVTFARPTFISDSSLSFAFNIDVDYGNRSITDTISTVVTGGAEWDETDWDSEEWESDNLYSDDWYTVNGIGRCVAPRLSGSFQGVSFSISAIDYIFERGGLI